MSFCCSWTVVGVVAHTIGRLRPEARGVYQFREKGHMRCQEGFCENQALAGHESRYRRESSWKKRGQQFDWEVFENAIGHIDVDQRSRCHAFESKGHGRRIAIMEVECTQLILDPRAAGCS